MVEAVTGERLGKYMQDHIFAPLGMNSSGFRVNADMNTRRASIHLRDSDGNLSSLDNDASTSEPEIDTGGSGLLSTVEDFTKFVGMILNKGACDSGWILHPETIAIMAANNLGENRIIPRYV